MENSFSREFIFSWKRRWSCRKYKNLFKIDDELVGAILLKDEAKHGTKEAIQALNSRGIVTKMFTGDNKKQQNKLPQNLE